MQSTRGGMQWTRREHLSMYSRKCLAGLRSRVATSSSMHKDFLHERVPCHLSSSLTKDDKVYVGERGGGRGHAVSVLPWIFFYTWERRGLIFSKHRAPQRRHTSYVPLLLKTRRLRVENNQLSALWFLRIVAHRKCVVPEALCSWKILALAIPMYRRRFMGAR